MAWQRPSIEAIIARVRADVESGLQSSAFLRRSLEYVASMAMAGAAHLLHGHIEYLAGQVVPGPNTEGKWLDIHAGFWLSDEPRKGPQKASGNVIFSGTVATTIPDGTELQRSDQTTYVTDGAYDIEADGTAVVPIEAVEAGSGANIEAGATLELVDPIAGVDPDATVGEASIGGGADTERDVDLLVRILERMRFRPKGGGPGDYEAWALEVEGITRAWEYPRQYGAGTVLVQVVSDEPVTGQTGVVAPPQSKVDEVQEYIDARAPTTVAGEPDDGFGLTVRAPTEVPYDIKVGLQPNTPSVRAAVLEELRRIYDQGFEPGDTALISQLDEAVSVAPGEQDHLLVDPADDAPLGDKTHLLTEISVLGAVTFADLDTVS